MLAAAASAGSQTFGRDAIVAIAGGTLLTVALTRPRLRWVERLTEDSATRRLWAERALTAWSFLMCGYAGCSVTVVLFKQVGAEADDLLRGAAAFLAIYALLVHFEPFAGQWRLRGGLATWLLYVALAGLEVFLGGMAAMFVLKATAPILLLPLLAGLAGLTVMAWIVYRLLKPFEDWLDGLFPSSPRAEQGLPTDEEPS